MIEYKFPPTLETAQQVAAIYHYDQRKDGTRCNYIPKTRQCDGPGGELKGIQRQIKNTLKLINEIKANANSFIGAASDLTNQIGSLINDATTFITGLVKTLIDKMRFYVVNKINNGIKDLINLIPPNLIPNANAANETATDTLQCVFNKIIGRLFNLVKGLLEDIVDKYINAPMCAIEQFVGDLLGNILGDITQGIDNALSQINGLLDKATSFIGDVFDVLDIISGVLKFLSCDEELDCSMPEEWSFWYGAKCFTDDISANLKSKIAGIATSLNSGETAACNTSAIPCGPPRVVINGNGSGALGNPIISSTGALLGIDIKNGGTSYTQQPNIQIVDDCGNGNGAVVYARTTDYFLETGIASTTGNLIVGLNPTFSGIGLTPVSLGENFAGITTIGISTSGVSTSFVGINTNQNALVYIPGVGTTTSGSIIDVVIIDPGVGYLPAPDGSAGGNDNTITRPNDSLFIDNDGNYTVLPPNTTIPVLPGNTIYLPPATNVPVYNNDGDLVTTLPGQGQTVPVAINTSGTITTPVYTPTNNQGSQPNSNGTYPVVLTIKDVVITNPGVAYTNTDTINITPDNGAVLNPVFGNNGQLINVDIIKPGIGFTDFPRITINSNTGFNAQITPVFGVLRISEIEEDVIPPGTSIINVVDCVGRTL